jgi:hypothetical protein
VRARACVCVCVLACTTLSTNDDSPLKGKDDKKRLQTFRSSSVTGYPGLAVHLSAR